MENDLGLCSYVPRKHKKDGGNTNQRDREDGSYSFLDLGSCCPQGAIQKSSS